MSVGVCIGDLITLYSDESKGYLISYQSGHAHCELALNIDDDVAHPQIPSTSAIVFKLCAQNRYKFNKNLKKIEENREKRSKDATQIQAYSDAKKAAAVETEENKQEQGRQSGKLVKYGQIIQLEHQFTNKFIHINATQTSWTETSNMLIELKKENGKPAMFRIMPRFKVKSEGEIVQANDHVILESVKSPRQYIHCSQIAFGDRMVYENKFEVNLSVQSSGFTLRKFQCRSESKNVNKLSRPILAGDVIRFYHKELEAYLVALSKVFDAGDETVNLRIRPMDQAIPKTMYPSSSALTYWQIEKEKSSVTGGKIMWDEPCRFRQMTTGQYLALTRNGKISLTHDNRDPFTVFKMHPVVDDCNWCAFESYARLKHMCTGQWLVSNSKSHWNAVRSCTTQISSIAALLSGKFLFSGPINPQFLAKDDKLSMKSLQYSTAVTKSLASSDDMSYDDAFALQEVVDCDKEIMFFVYGMTPFLRKFLNDVTSRLEFTPRRLRRVLATIDEISNFLMVNEVPSKKRQKLLRNFNVVDYIVEILQVETSHGTRNEALTDILSSSYKLLYTYLRGSSRKNELYMARHLEFFLEQLTLEDSIGLNAALMITELICDNRKIIDRINQKHVKFFINLAISKRDHRYLDILNVLCKCGDISLSENQRLIVADFHEQCVSNKNESILYFAMGQEIERTHNRVYISVDIGKSWHLLSDYLKEVNQQNLNYLLFYLKLYTYVCYGRNDECLQLITEGLKLMSFEIAFFGMIDTDLPYIVRQKFVKLISHLFVNVTGNTSVLDKIQLVFIYADVPTPGQPVRHSSTGSVSSSAVPLPYLGQLKTWINSFLDDCDNMVGSQIDKNKFIKELVKMLRRLVSFGYYGDTEDVKKLLKPLMAMTDGRTDLPFHNIIGFTELVKEYQESKRFLYSLETSAIVKVKYQALQIIDLFYNLRFNTRLLRFVAEFKQKASDSYFHEDKGHNKYPFLDANFDALTNKRKAREMKTKMNDIFEESAYIPESFVDILLDLCRYKYDVVVVQSLRILNRYYAASENLFDRAIQAQILLNDKSCKCLNNVAQIAPKLRLISKNAKFNTQTSEEIVDIMMELQRFCRLEEDPAEPNRMCQDIIYNHGILADTLDIVTRDNNSHEKHVENVFKSCFMFLKYLCRGHSVIQRRLFRRIGILIQINHAEDEKSDMFIELFGDDKLLCLQVMQSQIETIVNRLAATKNPVVVRLLACLVKVRDIPLKRNQTLVLKALLQHRDSIKCVLDTSKEALCELLQSEESDFDQLLYQKRYTCNVVQLLAFCSIGNNKTAESVCQCIFEVDTLLEIILLKDICSGLQKAFVQFLVNAFMMSDTELAQNEMKNFHTKQSVWTFLNHTIEQFNRATNFIETNPKESQNLLKVAPTRIHKEKTDTEHEMKELLHYLIDAVIPFILAFYQVFLESDTKRHEINQHRQHVSEMVASAVARFGHHCSYLVGDPIRLKELRNSVKGILAFTGTMDLNSLKKSVHSLQPLSESTVENNNEEMKLNKLLNVFTQNVQSCYSGPNTVQEQLGIPHNNDQYCQNGYFELPLGEEFQKLVSCFHVSNSEKNFKVSYLLHSLRVSSQTSRTSERERLEQNTLDIKCLKVIRALHHNEVVKNKRSEVQTVEDGLIQLQNTLMDLQLTQCIIPHLSSTANDMVREVLATMCYYLYGGNHNVQQSFVDYFLGTREEKFFYKIKSRMAISNAVIKEKRAIFTQHKTKIKKVLGTRNLEFNPVSEIRSHKSIVVASLNRIIKQVRPTVNPMSLIKASSTSKDKIPLIEMSEDLEAGNVDPFTTALPEEIAEILQLEDYGYFEMVLKVLSRLCDGQNIVLQDYLREQPDNIKSINLITEVSRIFGLIYSSIDMECIELAKRIIDALTEFSLGCLQNQIVVFDQKIVDYVNYVIRCDCFVGCTMEEEFRLFHSIGSLINALTEEDIGGQAKLIMASVDKDGLVKMVAKCYQMSHDTVQPASVRTLANNTGSEYFHLICRAIDFEPSLIVDSSSNICEFMKADEWSHFQTGTLSIEVMHNDSIQRIYFPVENKGVIRKSIKEKIKWEVDRSSGSAKLRDYIKWAKDVRNEVVYQKKVQHYSILRWLVRMWRPLNYGILCLTYLINILVLIFWVAPEHLDPNYQYSVSEGRWEPVFSDDFHTAIIVLSVAHNFCSAVLLITYFLANKPKLPRFIKYFKYGFKSEADENTESRLEKRLLSFTTLYYIAYMVFSIFGTTMSAALFSFHMLHIALNNQLLNRVIQAVTMNGKSLLWVGFLGLIFFYVFAIIGFTFLRDIYHANQLFCGTLWQCFLTTIREGLMYGFTERFDLDPEAPHFSFENYGLKMIFDIAFFILISTIGLNIIFGIIVDTFSELRDSKWQIESDMRGNCFICGITRYDFDHHTEGFDFHTTYEHNMWSYMFFFIYLDENGRNDLSALELYVLQMLEQQKTDFFPLGYAMSLKSKGTEDSRFDVLFSHVEYIIQRFEDEDLQREREKELERQRQWEEQHSTSQTSESPEPTSTLEASRVTTEVNKKGQPKIKTKAIQVVREAPLESFATAVEDIPNLPTSEHQPAREHALTSMHRRSKHSNVRSKSDRKSSILSQLTSDPESMHSTPAATPRSTNLRTISGPKHS